MVIAHPVLIDFHQTMMTDCEFSSVIWNSEFLLVQCRLANDVTQLSDHICVCYTTERLTCARWNWRAVTA